MSEVISFEVGHPNAWKCHHCGCPIWSTSPRRKDLPEGAIIGVCYHHGGIHCWPCLKEHHRRGWRLRIKEQMMAALGANK